MSAPHQLRHLTQQQLDSYNANGFLLLQGALSHEECDEFLQHLEDVRYGRKSVDWHEPLDLETTEFKQFHHRWFNQHRVDPIQMHYLMLTVVRDVLWDIMSSEPVGLQSMVFFKPPEFPGQAYHQDSNYIATEPESLHASWIALEDADEENGCMYAIPGSNNGDILSAGPIADTEEHEDWTSEVIGMDFSKEVPLCAAKGDIIFFHGRLLHRSKKNRSTDRFRRAYACHYMAADADTSRKDLEEKISLT
jgi:phytanoyl-CoA hydroxylase